ncbi:MAG: tripartite tricarboxylate transporter substrate binding protein [Actinobacteria bacterium]|nr:tripartite tricarboxylate transporter substrate binding protein [Actinomycetota bacterium]
MKISTFAKAAAVGTALLLALTACSSPKSDQSAPADSGSAAFTPLTRVELIAPAAPGSGWDQTARATQGALQTDKLAKTVTVNNVPGASGTVALAQVAPKKGQKDLLIMSGLAMMSGVITNGTSVSLGDLTPIARLVGEHEAIVVPKGSSFASIDDLFAAIKKDPKSVAIAGGSAGSADHLFIGLLAQHYGVKPADVNYVPYSGGGEATTALLGGKVQAGIAGTGEFAAQIQSGELTGLLVSSLKNDGDLPFAQAAGEIDPKLEFANWRSIMAPGGLDDKQRTQYLAAIEKMHGGDAWKAELAKNAWIDNYIAGDEFASWLKSEDTRVASVLKDLGLAK